MEEKQTMQWRTDSRRRRQTIQWRTDSRRQTMQWRTDSRRQTIQWRIDIRRQTIQWRTNSSRRRQTIQCKSDSRRRKQIIQWRTDSRRQTIQWRTDSRRRLLHKLNNYGIRNNTLLWIQDFLSHRTQEVQLQGHKSTTTDVLSGVPQGTVLGLCSSYYLSTIYQSQLNPMPDCSQMTACCFDQYEIIGIDRISRTTSTHLKNGRIDDRWPSIQKSVWWYEFPTSVNLSTLGIPSTDTCSKKSTPVNILELPSVKTYDGMITSTPSLPRPIEHWVS